jgi:hypothetical protein
VRLEGVETVRMLGLLELSSSISSFGSSSVDFKGQWLCIGKNF